MLYIPLPIAQKSEAAGRMATMRVNQYVIDDFRENDAIYYNDNGKLLKYNNRNPVWNEYIDFVEKNLRGKVFFMIHDTDILFEGNRTNELDEMLTIIFVSRFRSEWKTEREEFFSGIFRAYVVDLKTLPASMPDAVKVLPYNGGFRRIYNVPYVKDDDHDDSYWDS